MKIKHSIHENHSQAFENNITSLTHSLRDLFLYSFMYLCTYFGVHNALDIL